MTKQLKVSLELASQEATKAEVSAVLMENQSQFNDFFQHHLPEDIRYSVTSGNMKIDDLTLDNDAEGWAEVSFDYSYYDGCKDRNYVDSKTVSILFTVQQGCLMVDMEYPPKWSSSDVY